MGATTDDNTVAPPAFAYLLKQWEALNLYCNNGWAEIDNNIAENALQCVALGREVWLRYVLSHIQDWPVNRLRDLLPWKI
ncbi:transposase [Pantoea agglomerans]|nr:transposase [Pantoea agglomerans]